MKCDIENDISQLDILLKIGILETPEHILFRSAFIDAVICLNDLLQKARDLGVPVTFKNDLYLVGKTKDITDAMSKVRNALCHVSSVSHLIDTEKRLKATFNVFKGTTGKIKVGDALIGSDYDDDICYTFGLHKLYLKRHIKQAFDEARANLAPVLKAYRTPESRP